MPGFIEKARNLIAELKGARIDPAALQQLWLANGAPPRLLDLAAIYTHWQARLRAGGWVDRAGIGWLAVEALEQGAAAPPAAWSPIIFDGFDNFTEVQLGFITALARLPNTQVIVTLTGDAEDGAGEPARGVHRRFHQTRAVLEAALGVKGTPLPAERPPDGWQPPLRHLRDSFLAPAAIQVDGGAAVSFVEASSRALEARAALRWIKERIVREGVPPAQCALLARSMQPYRLLISQTAAEFGLTVHIEDGLPLASNPAVATLLQLLQVIQPGADGLPSLPRRQTVDLWRSPYLMLAPFGAQAGDADLLDSVGRLGLVAAGAAEWRAALAALGGRVQTTGNTQAPGDMVDDAVEPAPGSVAAAAVQRLSVAFNALLNRLQPLPAATVGEHVRWLEELIGADIADADSVRAPSDEQQSAARPSLGIMQGIHGAEADACATAGRDIAAMRALKELLRGLIWAEEIVEAGPQPFGSFVADLTAAVEATSFHMPVAHANAIFAGATVQARGVPFRVVAVLGMAEGELPSRLSEDPFLREEDRTRLRGHFPGVKSSIESTEAEFFLDTLTRPRDALLLVRPRISDSGAAWEPSSYWLDVRARIKAEPELVALGHPVQPQRAASMAELLEAMAPARAAAGAPAFAALEAPQRERMLARAALHEARVHGAPSPWDGDLRAAAEQVRRRYHAAYTWSATALESYLACPFQFFLQKVLQIEPRAEPEDGPGAAQIGTLYHHIMQALYAPHLHAAQKPAVDALLAALPAVAGPILASAPVNEGFRAPPSWQRTCDEIVENCHRSVVALDAIGGTPIALEYYFGQEDALHLDPPGDASVPWPDDEGAPMAIQLRGHIDRVDRLPNGSLLIIDYKLGRSAYQSRMVVEKGKKLQLALYTGAARRNLGGGAGDDGRYFFMQKSEAAGWSLADLGGADAALQLAASHAAKAVAAIRSGDFRPQPPDEGCPSYCGAAAFCWHYAEKAW